MHDKSPRQYTAQQDSDRQEQIEMDDGDVRRNSSRQRLLEAGRETNTGTTGQGVVAGLARHTLGLMLLLLVVFLWTLSNFLGSVSAAMILPPPGLLLLRSRLRARTQEGLTRPRRKSLWYRAYSQTTLMRNPFSLRISTRACSCWP